MFVSASPPGHLRVLSVRGILALRATPVDFVNLRRAFELGKPLPAPTLGTLPELPPQTQILVKPVFAYN